MIVIFTFALLVLLAIGVPVAFSLGASGLLGMVLFMPGDGALEQIPILAYKALDDFVLCAVPLYILMSAILLKGKVGEDLFDLGNKWLRHLPGGLGIATIVACGIFAAITGSSVACAVTVGAIAIPEMLKRGYDRSVVLGAVAGGGTLGILIPPSIPMILYGSITGESIGQLFMSGVLPGVLMTVFFIFIVVYRSRHLKLEKKGAPFRTLCCPERVHLGTAPSCHRCGRHLYGAFTPTEAAAVGTVYALFITFVIYRTLSVKDLPGILMETVGTSAMIFAIMIGASLIGFVLTILQVPQALTMMVAEVEVSRWVFFILINLLLLFLGCILETVSIIFITVPILYPIIKQLGFDPIWFNVVMQINMEMALITPPVGMNLFVLKGVSPESRMEDIIRGVIPYIGAMAVEILFLCFVPELATWLPSVVK